MKKRECIVIAYYLDDKFAGWYGDTQGSITKYPKIYSVESIDNVISNFKKKIDRIQNSSFDEEKENAKGLEVLSLLIFSSEDLIKPSTKVALRSYKCPIYDGPNPNYKEGITPKRENWIYANHADLERWVDGGSWGESIDLIEIIK